MDIVFLDHLNNLTPTLPDEEDLNGVVAAVLRLQDTYRLTAYDIAEGTFTPANRSPRLSGLSLYLQCISYTCRLLYPPYPAQPQLVHAACLGLDRNLLLQPLTATTSAQRRMSPRTTTTLSYGCRRPLTGSRLKTNPQSTKH